MGTVCGWQDPGGPHAGPINFAIWEGVYKNSRDSLSDYKSNVSEIWTLYHMTPTNVYLLMIFISSAYEGPKADVHNNDVTGSWNLVEIESRRTYRTENVYGVQEL